VRTFLTSSRGPAFGRPLVAVRLALVLLPALRLRRRSSPRPSPSRPSPLGTSKSLPLLMKGRLSGREADGKHDGSRLLATCAGRRVAACEIWRPLAIRQTGAATGPDLQGRCRGFESLSAHQVRPVRAWSSGASCRRFRTRASAYSCREAPSPSSSDRGGDLRLSEPAGMSPK
jgi:hypothetical protein